MAEESSNLKKYVVLALILIALFVSVGYQLFRTAPEDIEPVSRTAFSFDVTWRCLNCSHTETGKAAVGPKTCPDCGQDAMYASITWFCPRHGAVPVAFQYDESGNPVEVKVGDGTWAPYLREDGRSAIRCPRCGGSMQPGG